MLVGLLSAKNGQYGPPRKDTEGVMKAHDFRKLIRRFDDLTPAQIQDATRRITEVRRKTEAIAAIETRAQENPSCPHCGDERRVRWGRTRTNIQRYRCEGCGRTFTGRTGSVVQRLHRPDLSDQGYARPQSPLLDTTTRAPLEAGQIHDLAVAHDHPWCLLWRIIRHLRRDCRGR